MLPIKFFSFKKIFPILIIILFFSFSFISLAATNTGHSESNNSQILFWIALILIIAKISSLIEKLKQPPVLGELLVGILLGNLFLLNINFFKPIQEDEIINFLAELGVVILLFQIGLESNIKEMKKIGLPAFLVALVGVMTPFLLGTYLVGPLFFPGHEFSTYIFLGATLTATSVGITARIFRDFEKLRTKEAQIILGAAVIDDVLGLLILAIVTALVTVGSISLSSIILIIIKALLFLIGAIIIGQAIAPWIGKVFSKIHTGVGMKFTLALSFGLIMAFLASKIGLAPIVGAFAAGLVLDPVHFRFFRDPEIVEEIKEVIKEEDKIFKEKISSIIDKYSHRHVEDLIEPLVFLLVPLFFVVTGMATKIDVFFDPKIIIGALAVTLAAFLGKIASGIAAGKGVDKLIVGVGMVPRGEVGLIFATIGKELGVIPQEIFSAAMVMIILTTLLTSPILAHLLRRKDLKKGNLKTTH